MRRLVLSIIGQSFELDLEKQDEKTFYVVVNNNKYEASLQDDSGKAVLIAVNGGLYTVELEGEARGEKIQAKVNERVRVVQRKGFLGARKTTFEKPNLTGVDDEIIKKKKPSPTGPPPERPGIVAPLPGKVVAVIVNVGDEIKKGDVVVILEAMKMENEIVSNKDGRVTEIRVKQGDTADTGDVLVVVG